jgi:prevent-host-death family protein
MASEIPVTEARAQFSELINRVGYGGERIVITRHGKPLIALVPASEAAVGTAGGTADDAEMVVLDLASSREDYSTVRGIAAQHSSDPQARDRTTK